MGKFDWGFRSVIIFLYVQFWIRLGTVSYRDKKVRTADSPAVRSVNKSCDTRNCVQNDPKYAICVLVATRLYYKALTLRWHQNGRDSVSNHQLHGCLFNRLFRRRSKKTSKLRVTGLCLGNSPGPVNSPHKGQLRGKCFHLMTSSWNNFVCSDIANTPQLESPWRC